MRASLRNSMATGLLALIVLSVTGSTATAQTSSANLTAAPESITITVLAGKTSPSVSVAVTASQAIPTSNTLGAAMVGDLVRDDNAARIPPSSFDPTVERVTDPNNQSFTLALKPTLDDAAPGKYSGNVRVTGTGVNPLIIPMTVNIQGGSAAGAFTLLVFGLLIGWVLKWYTNTGSKLASETRRYQSLRRKLGTTPSENLPKFVRDEIDDVNQGFNDLDQAMVDAALIKLESQITGIPAIADAAAHVHESIQQHITEISGQGLPFGQIPINERRRLNDDLNEAKDLDEAKKSLQDLLVHVNAITACLSNAADTGRRKVLALYNTDDFPGALNAYQNLPQPPATAPAAAATATLSSAAINPARLQSLLTTGKELENALAAAGWQASVAATMTKRGQARPAAGGRQSSLAGRWRWFLGHVLPPLIVVLTIVILALIGLKTQWSSNDVFGSAGIIDDVALFLWGVAAFVTGKTLSDFLSNIVSS